MDGRGRELTLNDYLRIFTSRKMMIVLPGLVGAVIGIALGFLLPKRFEARTLFFLKDRSFLLQIYGPAINNVPFQNRLGTIQDDLKSYQLLTTVLEDPSLDPEPRSDAAREEMIARVRADLEVTLTTAKVGDQQIEMTFEHHDPHFAYKFLNKLRDVYIDRNVDAYRDSIHDWRVRLANSVKDLENTLKAAGEEKKDFETKNPDLFSDPIRLRSTVTSNQKTLAALVTTIASLTTEIVDIQGQLDSTREVIEHVDQKENPAKVELHTKVETLKLKLLEMQEKYSDAYAPFRELKKTYEELHAAFVKMPDRLPVERRIVPNPAWIELNQQLVEKQGLLEENRQQQSQLEHETKKAQLLSEALPGLRKTQANLQATYESINVALGDQRVQQERAEITWEVSKDAAAGLYEVLERARLPREPVFPSRTLFALGGVAAGLAAGLGLALLRELSRQTFGSVEEAKSALRVPVMGAINVIRGDAEVLRLRRRRAMAAMMALIILLSGLAFAIVYAEFPDYLPEFVRDSVTSVRDRLR